MKRVTRCLAVFLLATSLGCAATWRNHGVVMQPPQKIRIAVLPVRSSVTIKRLKSIRSLPRHAATTANEKELIATAMAAATKKMTQGLEERLGKSYLFEVVPHAETDQALTALGLANAAPAPTPEQIKELGTTLHAALVLAPELSGYGRIKKRWVFLLIGSGIVEGAVDGVVVGLALDNPWLAAGLATEEVLQEALTWGGGVFLFNRIFTPVILETKLLNTTDGTVVWKKTALARTNNRRLKTYPKEERKKKELRLQLTAERAVEETTRSLEQVTWRNVRAADRPPRSLGTSQRRRSFRARELNR